MNLFLLFLSFVAPARFESPRSLRSHPGPDAQDVAGARGESPQPCYYDYDHPLGTQTAAQSPSIPMLHAPSASSQAPYLTPIDPITQRVLANLAPSGPPRHPRDPRSSSARPSHQHPHAQSLQDYEHQQLQTEHAQLREEHRRIQAECARLRREAHIHQQAQTERDELEAKCKDLEEKCNELQAASTAHARAVGRATSGDARRLMWGGPQPESWSKSRKELRDSIDHVRRAMEQLHHDLRHSDRTNTQLTTNLEAFKQRLKTLHEQVILYGHFHGDTTVEQRLRDLLTQYEIGTEKPKEITADMVDILVTYIGRIQAENIESDARCKQAMEELESLRAESSVQELAKLRDKYKALKEELSQTQKELALALQDKVEVTEDLARHQATSSGRMTQLEERLAESEAKNKSLQGENEAYEKLIAEKIIETQRAKKEREQEAEVALKIHKEWTQENKEQAEAREKFLKEQAKSDKEHDELVRAYEALKEQCTILKKGYDCLKQTNKEYYQHIALIHSQLLAKAEESKKTDGPDQMRWAMAVIADILGGMNKINERHSHVSPKDAASSSSSAQQPGIKPKESASSSSAQKTKKK